MVSIPQPKIILREGIFKGEIEENLRKYGKFVKVKEGVVFDYRFFKRGDPSLISIYCAPIIIKNMAGITIVSYEDQRNQEILSELEEKLKLSLLPLESTNKEDELIKKIQQTLGDSKEQIAEIYKEMFSRLVLS